MANRAQVQGMRRETYEAAARMIANIADCKVEVLFQDRPALIKCYAITSQLQSVHSVQKPA